MVFYDLQILDNTPPFINETLANVSIFSNQTYSLYLPQIHDLERNSEIKMQIMINESAQLPSFFMFDENSKVIHINPISDLEAGIY